MSSFYGIFYRNSKQVSQEEAQKMQQTFDWWKPDESDFVIQDNILIGQATLYNTPESKYEHLPLKKANYILAMDARIDNREELAKELELPDKPLQEIGDSEFILASYHKWGKECADKLLGDFAFVIWDEAKQELFCARDFIGVRPFYYYVDDEKFIFGSDLKALSQHHDIPLDIRDESVANYIVNQKLTDRKHTFFKSVCKLEDGCYMSISKNSYDSTRYWHPNRVKKRKLPNEQAYIDELRKLLEDSVKARLRTEYNVASHLSGGLDSSPIAVLASREIKKQKPNYRLPVYSWQPEPTKDDDLNHHEWAYAIEVAKQEDMKLTFSTLDTDTIYKKIQTKDLYIDQDSLLWYEIPIREELKKQNVRVMLSGWGGDEFVTNHGYAFYTQMLLQGRWIRFYKELKYKIKKRNMTLKQIVKFLYTRVFIPILPTKYYCYMPKIKCKEPDWSMYDKSLIPLLQSAYKQKTHIFSRYTSITTKADIIRAWENGHVQFRANSWSQEALSYKTQYTFPLLDKRLVELSFSLPIKGMVHKGYDRYMYRKAIEDLVSPLLLWGVHKNESKRATTLQKMLFSIYSKLDNTMEEEKIYQYFHLLKL